MIVFLVGYMGCGKTTIGRRLARRLGYDFADTDDRIEKQEGADVCDIFHYAGEEYFRKAERGMLEQLRATTWWFPRAAGFPSGRTTWPV